MPAGKVTALLGRNGVGKTTLLRTLMGLVPARERRDSFRRQEHHRRRSPTSACAPGIGYVPQGREIFPRLTVEENLRDGPRDAAARRARAGAHLRDVPGAASRCCGRRGGDLSGGQQQQLAIGRALAMGPKLLILDEPTEGIQPSIIKDIERVIRALAATGEMAILLVEQYYDFARSLADQYLVMERGEIVERGAGADMDTDGVQGPAGGMIARMQLAEPIVSVLEGRAFARLSRMSTDRTVLARRRHDGPLVVQKPLYPGRRRASAMRSSCIRRAGLPAGMSSSLTSRAAEGASALLTTPGAAKWYRSAGAVGEAEAGLRRARARSSGCRRRPSCSTARSRDLACEVDLGGGRAATSAGRSSASGAPARASALRAVRSG